MFLYNCFPFTIIYNFLNLKTTTKNKSITHTPKEYILVGNFVSLKHLYSFQFIILGIVFLIFSVKNNKNRTDKIPNKMPVTNFSIYI